MTEPRPTFIPEPSSEPTATTPRPSRFPALMWGAVAAYGWAAFFIYRDYAVAPADHAAVRLLGIACGAVTAVAFVYAVRWLDESDPFGPDVQQVSRTDPESDAAAGE